MSHRLLPGAKLVEREIVEALGSSRVIARQALIKLAEEGLVQWQPNKGASVANPDIGEVVALFDALVAIEQAAIGRAAELVGSEEWTKLREQAHHDALHKIDPAETSADFHIAIVAMTRNRYLIEFYQNLQRRKLLVQALYGYEPRARPLAHDHQRILALIEDGKIARARTLIEKHQADVLRTYSLRDTTRRSLPLREALLVLADGNGQPPSTTKPRNAAGAGRATQPAPAQPEA